PLGGSRGNQAKQIRNIFIIFIVSGFWHGANWTFIAWGFLNALYFLPQLLLHTNRKNLDTVAENSIFPSISETIKMATTFLFTCLAWIFFRSDSIGDAFSYISTMSLTLNALPSTEILVGGYPTVVFFGFLLIVEWFQRKKQHGLVLDGIPVPRVVRLGIYIVLIISILGFGSSNQQFIYFQF
ncbi:MAG: MBOAT family protein, partial [Bacteroidetes bacterium]|nr:MBOAT family protein [Bacteroidota bacterium]